MRPHQATVRSRESESFVKRLDESNRWQTLLNTVYSLHNTLYGILNVILSITLYTTLINTTHGDHMEHQMPRKLILICRALPNETRLRRLYDYRPSHWVARTARSRQERTVRRCADSYDHRSTQLNYLCKYGTSKRSIEYHLACVEWPEFKS